MFDEEGFSDDDMDFVVEVLDTKYLDDAADFFATSLLRQFPGVQFESFEPTEWRRGWRITLPVASLHAVQTVEDAAFELQQRFFWDKDILLGYTVSREEEDDLGDD